MSIKAVEAQDGPATAAPVSYAALAFPGRLSITAAEFAAATGLGRTRVYQGMRSGEIPTRRVGERYLIPLSVLDEWLRPKP